MCFSSHMRPANGRTTLEQGVWLQGLKNLGSQIYISLELIALINQMQCPIIVSLKKMSNNQKRGKESHETIGRRTYKYNKFILSVHLYDTKSIMISYMKFSIGGHWRWLIVCLTTGLLAGLKFVMAHICALLGVIHIDASIKQMFHIEGSIIWFAPKPPITLVEMNPLSSCPSNCLLMLYDALHATAS